MMYSHGSGMGWLFLLPAVLLIALALTALLAFRPAPRDSAETVPANRFLHRGAEKILADRFAHGEIDAEEYEQRLTTLRASGG